MEILFRKDASCAGFRALQKYRNRGESRKYSEGEEVIEKTGGRVARKKKIKIYLIGSLRNPETPKIAQEIRRLGFIVFDDWYAAGPEADDKWRDYEKARGHTYREALKGLAANHVYQFDLKHLNECDIAILYLPAGKSGHLELGYAIGKGKRGYILLDNPERWDVMYLFAHGVFHSFKELEKELRKIKKVKVKKNKYHPNRVAF